ncbi:HU family DNA-binding protein [Rickettsiales endosymbiont of Paramecium tredecaurelia]|uniref:HU family DNA-binding protein n=1 Tax=Candidatus Sarmatiella mevalonica TaxID=2770581 RepID=UPI0019247925|nr:HU family DNA-binding protein [Candidatus Sarmatiella mevalonica]MBL3284659.1 HU family DNA-binding protein [Candidatus Sarmatiella mevalonica]
MKNSKNTSGKITYRKDGLVGEISSLAGVSKAEATRSLDMVLQAILSILKKGSDVSVMGFGSFEIQERAARCGRNPRNGERLDIPAYKQPVFKAGQNMKDAVNGRVSE